MDGIEYSDFGKILFDKFSIIVGINNDFESNILDEYGIKKIAPGDLVGDLHKNSLTFADIIISLGYGKKYADGVLVDDPSTLNIVESTESVLSGGVATNDINNIYSINIGHLVGNIEIHVSFIRYYCSRRRWNFVSWNRRKSLSRV